MSHLGLLMSLETEKEFVIVWLRDPSVFEPEHFSTQWVDEEAGIRGVFGLLPGASARIPVFILFSRAENWTMKRARKWLQAHPQYSPDRRLQEGRKLRKKLLTPKIARQPSKRRRKTLPGPVINLTQKLPGPGTGNRLVGETLFFPSAGGLLDGPEWMPRAAVENAPRRKKRR